MSAIDDLIAGVGADPSVASLAAEPVRRVAIVTCMDARIDPGRVFGVRPGDVHVIRNAGAVVTEDVIRSLVLSVHALGVRAVAVMGHTRCGVCGLDEDDLRERLAGETGIPLGLPFGAFDDLDEHVRRQVAAVRDHPWLGPLEDVRGLVYDVGDGTVRSVST